MSILLTHHIYKFSAEKQIAAVYFINPLRNVEKNKWRGGGKKQIF